MKFLSSGVSILMTSLLAAGVSSAPFSVSKFNAGATPHSSLGYVELTWSYAPAVNTTRCSARPSTYQAFPSVEHTQCSNSATSFNLTKRADGGADLELWYETAPDVFAYGLHAIQPEQIVWTNQQSPTGTVQVYQGPQNFTVKAASPGA